MTAALGPRTTSAWIGPVGYGDRRSCGDLMHDGERALAARQRYHRALDAVVLSCRESSSRSAATPPASRRRNACWACRAGRARWCSTSL
jgi:hypothetical protein